MLEATIKYEKPETLELVERMVAFFDSNVIAAQSIREKKTINGVTVLLGDKSASIDELREVFSGKNLDAAQLRKDAWKRKR